MMTKEVLIHIKTQQILRDEPEDNHDDNQDVIELITTGEYYFRNGTHYLLYEETMEGFKEPTKNLVKVRPDFMEVRKKGTVDVTMTFEKGKIHTSAYKTPFGILQMEITSKQVALKETAQCMEIGADYILGMNGSPVADCKMQMRVTAQGDKENTTFFGK